MLFGRLRPKTSLPSREEALPDRARPILPQARHMVLGTRLDELPEGFEQALFGMGCFWGAERKFWTMAGVHSTAVGYAAGHTRHPSYEDVCSGRTGHAEVVRVVFDPNRLSYRELLRIFWESHDPTQGMRQGNDVGTQYRSGIYCFGEVQREEAEASRTLYQDRLSAAGYGPITTEILAAPELFFAEEYHQQYLAKNPDGYCGLGGTGVACPASPIGMEEA